MRAAPPLRAAGKNGPNNERIGERLDQDNNKSRQEFQMQGDLAERLRIARLRRQFGFDDALAALVATLAFATTEAR
ncbi:hypothetical protein AMST5_02465 [freshwater sediment metagenome]|uniref:Uncharacterized protein n=1 Tax=freshwater sediment metagenome TaxID=556182 RepID=A0AA48M1Z0_9ZZZZ